jgi:DNA-binding transcriptional LysR family regulator
MSRRLLSLPPLDLLRGFVAVGRCMSVTAAARELALTQPALSRQIPRPRGCTRLRPVRPGSPKPRFKAVGVSRAKPGRITRFTQYDQVIQAALAGNGVALARLELARPLLETGRLRPATGNSRCPSLTATGSFPEVDR